MSESQEQTNTENLINDQILQEFEKISNLEKKQKSLSISVVAMRKDVNNIKATIDKSGINEEEQEKKDDVVEEDELKPYLNTTEKKRYQIIGQEFMKGAKSVFNEIKKQRALQEKMTTQSKEVKQIKKIEEEKEKDKTKKKKGSKFLMIGLAITAVAGLLYIFRDKLKNIFNESDELGNILSSFTNGFGNFGQGLISQILDAISNTITGFFGNTDGSLYSLIDTFFTQTLPKSIKYAGVHIISLFSEKAASSLNVETSQMSARSDAETDASVMRARQNYDSARAGQAAAAVSGIAGAGTEAEQQAALMNLGITSLDETLQSVFIPLMNQRMFQGLTTEEQKKSVAFEQNTYNVRALMEEFASTEDERIVAMRERMRQGKSTEEDKILFAQMMGGHFGRKVDEEYQQEINRMFFGESGKQNAAALIRSADTFIENTRKIEDGIASNRATARAREDRIKRRQAELERQGESYTINISPMTITENLFVEETDKFFNLVKNIVDGAQDFGKNILENTKNFYQNFIKESFERMFLIIGDIFKGLPFVQNPEGIFTEGKNIRVNRTYPSTDYDGAVQTENAKRYAYDAASIFDVKNSNRPLVIVSLSLDGNVLDKFSTINTAQGQILENIKKSNDKLEHIVKSIEDVEKLSEIPKTEDEKNKLGLLRVIFDVAGDVKSNTGRITNIETYLEQNDKDEDSSGVLSDFVLQTQSS